MGLNEADTLIKLELEDKLRVRLQEFEAINENANLRGMPIPTLVFSELRQLKELLEEKSLGK